MISQIRKSRFSKVLASYLALMLLLECLAPYKAYAITSGPKQPEFNAFTPIDTSDMVDLASGNFNYNIPVMDVGGYPINLAYSPSLSMAQEASWTGLGWNLNIGQIEREVRGLPDDFRGDEMRYENDLRDNITVGASFVFHPALFGVNPSEISVPFDLGFGLGVQYNNYEGITFDQILEMSAKLAGNVSVGCDLTSSVADGATVNPSVSISKKREDEDDDAVGYSGGGGLSYNSRRGLQSATISGSSSTQGHSGATGLSYNLNTISYTPTKRVAYDNGNFNFNAKLGVEIFGVEGQGAISGYGSYQKINSDYKNRKIKAYGYENSQYKTGEGVLDFNRENENTVTKNTTVLPITNYSYDLYAIDGQGVGGSFRPTRSQVTHVYNDDVTDIGVGKGMGVEIGTAEMVHVGVNLSASGSSSTTGNWNTDNNVLPRFKEKYTDKNKLFYEPVAFKMLGETNADEELSFFSGPINGASPMRIKLDKSRYNNKTESFYQVKGGTSGAPTYTSNAISGKIKRTKRLLRNQVVQKISDEDAKYDPFITRSSYALPHHTAGIKVLKADGSTYVYGKPVYNTKKVEATFDVSKKSAGAKYNSGLLGGITSPDNNNSNNSDKYKNKITTPAYAHSFLLTSVLSTDYEDLTGDGPSNDDLGSFTKMEYQTSSDAYKWRTPYEADKVSFNEGLKSNKDDEKGNYIYGEKELVYVKRIITKTHVAIFSLSAREDARGASAELGTANAVTPGRMMRLDKISLYSYEDAKKAKLLDDDANNDLPAVPIKTANFEYSYKLCKHITNNLGSGDNGKLTLEKVYFTYRNSNMGKYTPYVFDYGQNSTYVDPENPTNPNPINPNNPDYDVRSVDVWGNYKRNTTQENFNLSGEPNTAEFPFVEQNKATANKNAQAWVLKSITLPSGGKIKIECESDDYQYVQNRKAVRMFKISGVGNEYQNPTATQLTDNVLYVGNTHKQYVYVDLGTTASLPANPNVDDYLSEIRKKAIYFRALVNMVGETNTQYDFVTGYFEIADNYNPRIATGNGHSYLVLKWKMLNREGGVNGGSDVNPISKAGWGFGRKYLNRVVYSMGGNSSNTDFSSIVKDLVKSIQTISELWKGPNKALQDNGCAKKFMPLKSWVRLQAPGNKYGGGLRVKKVSIEDNWNVMTNDSQNKGQDYGQQYDYTLDGTNSSGVATYEPNNSAENPLVEPFYSKIGSAQDKLVAPRDQNYVEKPFGSEYFPSPRVTYSKVTVKNLPRETEDHAKVVQKHATGSSETTFYTSKDFPTISDYTDIDMAFDKSLPIMNFLNVFVVNHLVASQGFSIETNDMDGKVKSQFSYDESHNRISGTEYDYAIKDGKLDNEFTTIDSKGNIANKLLGVQYDVINDFNESNSHSFSAGADLNVAGMIFGIFPFFLPIGLPKISSNENILRTAVTTKVVMRTGILTKVTAHDLQSTIATENLAWDSDSGEPLLTRTTNEFDDAYYKLDYPAYWYYDNMGLASRNIGLTGNLIHVPLQGNPNSLRSSFTLESSNFDEIFPKIQDVFKLGDELMIPQRVKDQYHSAEIVGDGDNYGSLDPEPYTRAWVVGYSKNFGGIINGVLLMKRDGTFLDPCLRETSLPFKLVRSARRNLQSGTMASVTSITNPIQGKTKLESGSLTYDASGTSLMVVNANAVEYTDFWNRPWQLGGKSAYPTHGQQPGAIDEQGNIISLQSFGVNPYVNNIKGDWHPIRSYAYLTGRNSVGGTRANPRVSGFYNRFNPFYRPNSDNTAWIADNSHWTNASTVSQYSAYGMEEENVDALNRYSSALYGYNNTLPVAVASNSRYAQMGAENFENGYSSHFGFNLSGEDLGLENYGLSTQRAHTGKSSMRVPAGKNVTLARVLADAPTPGRDIYSCQGETQPTDNPKCPVIPNHNVYTAFNANNVRYYSFTFPVDFGSFQAATSNAVSFCNAFPGYAFDYTTNTITYYGTAIPRSTYLTLRDSHGNCRTADIVVRQNPQSEDPTDLVVEVRGCSTACQCN